jgi:hypothetical protein
VPDRICSVEGCDRKPTTRRMCPSHYARWLRTGDAGSADLSRHRRGRLACSLDDCDSPVVAWLMCDMHYRRWKKYGDPLTTSIIVGPDDEPRFWQKVNKDGPLPASDTLAAGSGPCWLWTGAAALSLAGTEYGSFRFDGKPGGAHRYSYRLHTGPLVVGMEIDHLCRVTLCVNPDHLEQVPPRTNKLRGVGAAAQAARRTRCPQDHEYTEENTYRQPGNPRHRECRTCIEARMARMREANARKKSA